MTSEGEPTTWSILTKMAEITANANCQLLPSTARPMDPALNTTVQAVERGDQITAKTWAIWGDNSALWDPVWSPEMHARADAVMGDLRAAIAAGEL